MLNFAHNSLTRLESNVFVNLNNLTSLDFDSNQIGSFDINAFNGLQGIMTINIMIYNLSNIMMQKFITLFIIIVIRNFTMAQIGQKSTLSYSERSLAKSNQTLRTGSSRKPYQNNRY